MADGIGPVKLLPLRLKWVRFRNWVKSSPVSVAVRLKFERSIWETVLVLGSQTMEVQLQRLLMFVRDHELREGGGESKLLFQLTKASACVVGDEVASNGSQESKRM